MMYLKKILTIIKRIKKQEVRIITNITLLINFKKFIFFININNFHKIILLQRVIQIFIDTLYLLNLFIKM